MWINSKFFKYATGLILSLLIVLLFYLTAPVFTPILKFIAAIFLPILFSTFLYYILRPFVNFLNRWLPAYLSIFLVYIVLICLTTVAIIIYAPDVMDTINGVSPQKIEALKLRMSDMINKGKDYIPIAYINTIENFVISYLPDINSFAYHLSVNLITTLASLTISLILTPFVLFYFLRDDRRLSVFLLKYVPEKFRSELEVMIKDIDLTISSFIITQMTLAFTIGLLLMVGYLLIGIPHAIALALFGMIFYVIPFLGTIIAIIPALIVAFSISFVMAMQVILVMIVAHFIDANFLTPRLMSTSLKIHPLTVILLLLAAGSLYGIFGMLLVTPTYAITKVVVWNIYKIFQMHFKNIKISTELTETPPTL